MNAFAKGTTGLTNSIKNRTSQIVYALPDERGSNSLSIKKFFLSLIFGLTISFLAL